MSGSNTENNNIYSSGIFYSPDLHGCQEGILGPGVPTQPTANIQKNRPKWFSPPLQDSLSD